MTASAITVSPQVERASPSHVPALFLQIGKQRWEVESYAEASEKVEAALKNYHGRYSDLPPLLLVTDRGAVEGYVSTNGKVWKGKPSEWKPGRTPLYTPGQFAKVIA